MTTLLIAAIICGICTLILGVMTFFAVRAPIGWQDEHGFHFGEPGA